MSPAAAFPDHGVESCRMNNQGGGWQIVCLCGWHSSCNPLMQETGEDFDQHLWNAAAGGVCKGRAIRRRRLAEEWDDYRRNVLPAVLVECRRAFFAGCAATWAAVIACNEMPDEQGVAELEKLRQELAAYGREVRREAARVV